MNNTSKLLFAFVIALALGAYFFPSATSLFGAEGDSNLTNLVTSGYITDGGALTVTGASTLTGATHASQFVEGGTVISTAVSSTLTAAQLCALPLLVASNTAASIVVTLPAATSTNASCLTADGDFDQFQILNNGTNTITFATSTGDTFSKPYNSSGTASVSTSTGNFPWAIVTVLRVTSSTNQYLLQQFQPGL